MVYSKFGKKQDNHRGIHLPGDYKREKDAKKLRYTRL